MLVEKTALAISKLKMFPKNGHILLGVSGGIDSSLMAKVVSKLALSLNISPVICHLNHSFRGEESDKDASFVLELSKELGVDSEIHKINMPEIISNKKGGSAQNLSRIERYKFFKEMTVKWNTKTLFLAHNLDDLCETFFMRLFRGSGLPGLSSISQISLFNGFKICRPFLYISREEITSYCKKFNIHFREDSSNKTDKYDRNKIRHHLIPFIKKEFNADIENRIATTINLVKRDEDYFNIEIQNLLQSISKEISDKEYLIRLTQFKKIHICLQTRIIRSLIFKIKGNLQNISYKNIMDIINICKSNENRKMISLPDSIKVEKINLILKLYLD